MARLYSVVGAYLLRSNKMSEDNVTETTAKELVELLKDKEQSRKLGIFTKR